MQGPVIADGADDFELKFTRADDEIISGYIGGLGKSLEGITVGELYDGEFSVEKNSKVLEILVDCFENNAVFGIYWYYTYPAAQQAMRLMETDTSGQKQKDEALLYIDLVNVARAQNNIPNVQMNSKLMNVAYAHSADMYENNYYSHTSLNGNSPGDCIKATGLRCQTWGENIAQGYKTVFHVHNGWMNSEGRRRNILNEQFEEIGFGVDNRFYTTVFFTGRD